jgi:hypothetical protein
MAMTIWQVSLALHFPMVPKTRGWTFSEVTVSYESPVIAAQIVNDNRIHNNN